LAAPEDGKPDGMTQFEQENDLGRGGGEVDEETMQEAWREADRRRSTANARDDEEDEPEED
jgi:hypothetical protein